MKKQLLIILGMMIATISVLANGDDSKLTVVVENVKSTEGIIRATLFDGEDTWLKSGKMKKVSINNRASVVVEFENVPNGTYAVSIVHDENANGNLDTNSFGMPTESYGFSNNARGMFGPPDFEESMFEVTGNKTIEITIK